MAKKTKSAKYDELVNLSEALVKEIDNVMKTQLRPNQLGQVLGSIVLHFQEQVDNIKKS